MAPSPIRHVFRVTRFKRDARSEVDEELAFHFAEVVRELQARGRTAEEARSEARRRFGDVERYRREMESMERTASEGWWRRVLDASGSIVAAAMFALRGIRRAPGVAVAVVGTLALGLGANVAMFRVVDRLLLSPPEHVRDADRVRIVFARTSSGARPIRMSGTFPDYQVMRTVGGFASVAAYTVRSLVVGEGVAAERMLVGVGSGDLFGLLGVGASAGRLFGPEDDRAGAQPTAVLSWETWDRTYDRDPGVLGSTLVVGNGRYTVVGVAPRGFTGVTVAPTDLWLPLEPFASVEEGGPWRESRSFTWLRLVARLAPAVRDEVAAEEATAAYRAARGDRASDVSIETSSLVAADRPDAGGEIRVAQWLGAVSLIVFLITCANVANLLLTRNLRRRREHAVRAALGLGRRGLVGQLTVEAAFLTVTGGIAGLLVAAWSGAALYPVLLPDLAFDRSIVDGRVLGFAGVAVVFATLLAGVLPALLASRRDLASSLRAGGDAAGAPRTRTQVALLAFQVALSVISLTAAAGFVRSVANLRAIDLGFQDEGLALIEVDIEGTQGVLPLFESDADPAWPPNDVASVYERVEERVAELPGVRTALVNPTPFQLEIVMPFEVPGRDSLPSDVAGPYPLAVSPEYFEVMGMRMVAGRGIEPEDDRFGAEPVVVLNRTMARALWPGEEALGRCVIPGGEGHPCATVVGVVEDAHRQAVVEADRGMAYYVPIRQQILGGAPTTVFVRSAGTDAGTIRAAAQSASPRIRFAQVTPFSDLVAPELRPWTLGATAFAALGSLALLVAALGLYSLFAFDVAGRRRELGIRAALGAGRHRLLGLVLRDVAVLGSGGFALGLVVVAGVRRWIDPLLYGTSSLDPETLVPVGAILLSVALVGAALPGTRAAQADPLEALRAE
jgi:predicted permease